MAPGLSSAIERDRKWYMYARCKDTASACSSPTIPLGPFTDPIGRPLIGSQYDSIDPTVYIDDKGQASLAWGNPDRGP